MAHPRAYTGVVLVIAHHAPGYDELRVAWKKNWDVAAKHGHLDDWALFFLFNDPNGPARWEPPHSLYFPHAETYPAPGLLQKTLDAMDWLERMGYTYRMIYRTNLSHLVYWPGFTQYVSAHLETQQFAAGVWYMPQHIQGSCMLLSADIAGAAVPFDASNGAAVAALRNEREKLNFDTPDDHAINEWLHSKKVAIQQVETMRCHADDATITEALERGVWGFRCHQSWGIQEDRAADLANMRRLTRLFHRIMPRAPPPVFHWEVHVVCVMLLCLFVTLLWRRRG